MVTNMLFCEVFVEYGRRARKGVVKMGNCVATMLRSMLTGGVLGLRTVLETVQLNDGERLCEARRARQYGEHKSVLEEWASAPVRCNSCCGFFCD